MKSTPSVSHSQATFRVGEVYVFFACAQMLRIVPGFGEVFLWRFVAEMEMFADGVILLGEGGMARKEDLIATIVGIERKMFQEAPNMGAICEGFTDLCDKEAVQARGGIKNETI